MEYNIDDSMVYESIDKMFDDIDLEYLIMARDELIRDGEDTEIIDKVIEKRKGNKERESKDIDVSKMGSILGLIEGLKKKNNSDVDNDYEDYNFEEEELEDDDYYFEDDK